MVDVWISITAFQHFLPIQLSECGTVAVSDIYQQQDESRIVKKYEVSLLRQMFFKVKLPT